VLAIACLLAGFAVFAPARADSAATVSPDAGDMQTLFIFSASGLTPGDGVIIAVFDAVGNRFSYQKGGVEQALVVDDSGAVAVALTPAGLGGAMPGDWRAVFQEEETGYTATIPFSVTP
jgi:hypothetical protein